MNEGCCNERFALLEINVGLLKDRKIQQPLLKLQHFTMEDVTNICWILPNPTLKFLFQSEILIGVDRICCNDAQLPAGGYCNSSRKIVFPIGSIEKRQVPTVKRSFYNRYIPISSSFRSIDGSIESPAISRHLMPSLNSRQTNQNQRCIILHCYQTTSQTHAASSSSHCKFHLSLVLGGDAMVSSKRKNNREFS